MAGSVTSSPESGRYYVLPAVGAPLRREDRAVPAPGPGEALVRIDACGVCGSDAFLQKGGFGADKLPVVPGHEAAGHKGLAIRRSRVAEDGLFDYPLYIPAKLAGLGE